jgi:hypothetical protein
MECIIIELNSSHYVAKMKPESRSERTLQKSIERPEQKTNFLSGSQVKQASFADHLSVVALPDHESHAEGEEIGNSHCR